MAIIYENFLFSTQTARRKSDIYHISVVLDVLSQFDEPMIRAMEKDRGKGNNKYPIRILWNTLVAGHVLDIPTVQKLIDRLRENGELRELCGIDPTTGVDGVPTNSAYSRFMNSHLKVRKSDVERIFHRMVDTVSQYFPEFGKILSIDSTDLASVAGKRSSNKKKDARGEHDATKGVKKSHIETHGKGLSYRVLRTWFGYKFHLIIDAFSELPVAFVVTTAKKSDSTALLPVLDNLAEHHPKIVKNAEFLTADKGYDSAKNNAQPFDKYEIKPMIPVKHMWRGGHNETRILYEDRADVIVYDEDGRLLCDPHGSGEKSRMFEMVFDGYEKNRRTLKYRCPAAAYGLSCPLYGTQCSKGPYGRVVRVPIDKDRRRFVPLPRTQLKAQKIYAYRSASERFFSRLKAGHGFKGHYVRGLAKMEIKVGISLLVVLASAIAALTLDMPDKIRTYKWPSTGPPQKWAALAA